MLPKWKAWNSMKQKPGEAKRFAMFSNRTAVGLWVTLKVFELFWRPQTKASIQSVQSLSYVWLFVTPWTAALQASLSITNSQSLLKLMSIKSVILSNNLILCRPLLLLPSIFPSIRVFSNESVLRMKWPNYWSFSFSISPSNEYSGLISFRIDWLDLLAVQGTLKSLLQCHNSKYIIYVHISGNILKYTHIFVYYHMYTFISL